MYAAYNETMDFSLNDHQKLIRDTVRQFMEAEVRASVKEMEKEEKFPAEAIAKLGENITIRRFSRFKVGEVSPSGPDAPDAPVPVPVA